MAEQRIMTINLRRGIEAVPPYRRAAAASKFVARFVKRHMKAEDTRIDVAVNDVIFRNGIKNPPVKIRLMCSKDETGIVTIKNIGEAAQEKK